MLSVVAIRSRAPVLVAPLLLAAALVWVGERLTEPVNFGR